MATVVVVVLGGGGTAYGLTRSSGHSYRTAVAATGSVTQTIAATGTVSPVTAADARFQVAGTVSKVVVKTGQHVHAGEVIARLNRSALHDQVRSAQSSLRAARTRLSADESGQSSSSSSRQPMLQADQPVVVSTPTSNPRKGSDLAQHQADVRAAQQATDTDLVTAQQALAAAEAACASADPSSPDTTSSDATDSPSPSPTATTADSTSCTTASAVLLAAQQQVDRDESRLADAEAVLSRDLAAMAGSAPSAANRSSQPRTNDSSQRADSAATVPVSAAQIALDQAAIDQARAQVAVAKASLGETTLRSTIDGRVAAVTLAHGDRVSVSSTDGVVKIVGSRQEQATIALSATQIRRIDVGQVAQVLPDGSTHPMSGRVVSIDAAGSTSSTGTTSYPVTVSLPGGARVVSGAAAAVTVVISSVDNALTVPTSAVHHAGSRSYVDVLADGKLVRRTVSVGAVGAALTQITSGLTAGQEVVLADIDQAVPSSSSNLSGGGNLFGRGGGGGRRFAQFVTGAGGGPLPNAGPSK
ncbi:MAG TPA: biotin/lipoyl-binding protein [Mycobacteriales bacterium]|nr:biotin/lipoyl-binding protein [Mycobacteriales bacterium]